MLKGYSPSFMCNRACLQIGIAVVCVVTLMIVNTISSVREFNRERLKYTRNARALSSGVWPVPHHIFFFTDGSTEVDIITAKSGWTTKIYNETTARVYIKDHCLGAVAAYDRIVPIAAKADIFRLCALLVEGGIYMDDDLFPIVPFETFALADRYGLLLVEDYAPTGYWGSTDSDDISVWQAFIGSAWPGHPFFVCALETVVKNIMSHTTEKDVLFISGPHALRKCSHNYLFRFQMIAINQQNIVKNSTNAVIIHKAFPTRRGRARHYSTYKKEEIINHA